MEKAELRGTLRARRGQRDAAALGAGEIALAGHAGDVPGRRLAAFISFGGEPPTPALLEALVAGGREVLVPILLADRDLDWRSYEGVEALGREAIATVDLVLAPALAVDLAGRRLGQGGGSYDRALVRTTAPVVAVVWDDEVLAEVPVEEHDRPVDGVLTPSGGMRWLREQGRRTNRSLP
jgi:5-formyltetrahydrofolate cyclo-ligase